VMVTGATRTSPRKKELRIFCIIPKSPEHPGPTKYGKFGDSVKDSFRILNLILLHALFVALEISSEISFQALGI
jgi:hypothetical protein